MVSSSSSTAEQPLCRLFSLADIQSATGGFSEAHVIGRGGFGKVYKALIDHGSAAVAVKRLASNSNQGEREFAMEMETLTKVRHRNLVSLIGYCREEGEMILVYEYIANGTLADHLYKLPTSRKPLSWNQRLRICIGAGRGLDYLHSGCSIIHRDVKSTNILLDDSFRAKVSDFGLAKHLGGGKSVSHVSASVKGSFGYFDPCYFTTGRLTRGSDTYAFGVVLLEMLSGRSALDRWMADEGYLCMSMWAQEKIRSGKADKVVAPVLRGKISESCLKTFVGVAKGCLSNEPKKRITMTRAVAQLELALEQHERRGRGASRFRFWPFRARDVASGSTVHKDELELEPEPEPEATHFTAKENEQASAATLSRTLRVDHTINELPIHTILLNSTPSGLPVNHSFDELPSYFPERRHYIPMNPTIDTQPIYAPTVPPAELENITQPRALQVDHTVNELPSNIPALPLNITRNGLQVNHSFDEFSSYVPTIPVAEQEDIAQPRVFQVVDHAVNELPSRIPAIPQNITRSGVSHSFDELSSFVPDTTQRRRSLPTNRTVDKLPIDVPAFPLAELEDITHDFSLEYMISEGSGGERIFRAVLKSGQDVAIKQFYRELKESDTVFRLLRVQVSKLSMLKHENMFRLLGYCLDGRIRALVYEYCDPRVSLHAILHEPEPRPVLSWPRRIKIAAGVARGLCYLHDNNLIHRDIRSDNIFVFDYEIAKLTHPHPKIPCSCERSRFNYDDPFNHEEGCETDNLTTKDDVYSFGLVLLELLTGTELFECTWKVQQEFVSWAKVRLFQDKVEEVVDPRLKADYPLKLVQKMGAMAKLCLHYYAYSRPDMSTVSQALHMASLEAREYNLRNT